MATGSEAPGDPSPRKRVDALFAVGGILCLAGALLLATGFSSHLRASLSWTTIAILGSGLLAAGLVLAILRRAAGAHTSPSAEFAADHDPLGTRAWEKRNPWFFRVVALAVVAFLLCLAPRRAAETDFEVIRLEYSRAAALGFLVAAGLAVEATFVTKTMQAWLPSPAARATFAAGVVAGIVVAGLLYFKGVGLPSPWSGPFQWGDTESAVAEILLLGTVAFAGWLLQRGRRSRRGGDATERSASAVRNQGRDPRSPQGS